jgi:copper chaperone CopZ
MHCVNKIQNAILAIEGVDFAEANAVTKQLVVEFEDPATDAIIRQKLAEIAYPAND